MSQEVCTNCLKPTIQRCHGCHLAYYCSAACQKTDWPLHREECKTNCVDYDEYYACGQLLGHLMGSDNIRKRFASMVKPPIHGVAIRCDNAVQIRMALRNRDVDLKCNFLTRADQYMDVAPISVTGMRPGKDYALLIEVKQHNGPLYASYATAVPFNFDEPGQPTVLVPPPGI